MARSLTDEYMALAKYCSSTTFTEGNALVVKLKWDRLTQRFLKQFKKQDLVDDLCLMNTLLDKEMGSCNKESYFKEFTGLLETYADRMTINRWCRLQLLICNAV